MDIWLILCPHYPRSVSGKGTSFSPVSGTEMEFIQQRVSGWGVGSVESPRLASLLTTYTNLLQVSYGIGVIHNKTLRRGLGEYEVEGEKDEEEREPDQVVSQVGVA